MLEQYLTLDFLALIIGIIGACLVGLNYILESLNKLGKDHKVFGWINLTASALLLYNAWYNSVWVFVGLNIFLISVGVFGLYKVYFSPEKN
jgi:hypothetical protein